MIFRQPRMPGQPRLRRPCTTSESRIVWTARALRCYSDSPNGAHAQRIVMAPRFSRGAIAYAKDGRSYVVDEVDGGIVYCSASNGTETEFPEAAWLHGSAGERGSGGRGGGY